MSTVLFIFFKKYPNPNQTNGVGHSSNFIYFLNELDCTL